MTAEEMQALVSMMSSIMDDKINGLRDEMGTMMDEKFHGLRDELKGEIRETRVLVEHQQHEIRLIAEKVELINEKLDTMNDRQDRIEKQLADHDARIFALEVVTTALKKAQ